MSLWGIAIDGVTWTLPHFVVWSLQLRRLHRLAISFIFALGILNLIVGLLRVKDQGFLAFRNRMMDDVVPVIIWPIARTRELIVTSTAIILACCPLLRPLFEKLIPKSLTSLASPLKKSRQDQSTIRVTTRIDVSNRPSRAIIHRDNWDEIRCPTFDVERSLSI
ncbi:hypothetical protein BCR34DRAFT_549469 [Clohesyomyces aquaticus]|uniref:Rhodopsin domain-containing protein n=1 Tax=Clohesyomyces aquaticus TaxID=1231657 RepID=A0A1Y1YDF2_9PLEO|nr:hypothetical protein BCR34DRAFT_549469 [Clohesyomyces aquaticus]